MLGTRNPELLRKLLTNFDALFTILNCLAVALCLGASFGFDERAAAFLLVPFPIFGLVVLGDATMADMDFKLRPYSYVVQLLFPLSGMA